MLNKKAQAGRYTAVLIILGLLILTGAVIPLLIGSFIDVSKPDSASKVYIVAIAVKGFFQWIPPWSFLPVSLKDYFTGCFNSFTYLPDYIALPCMLVLVISVVYILITLIPTVGG